MPFYELSLVLRPMKKKEVVECLKRTADLVWKENGVLKRIEFLGEKKLPFKIPSPEEGVRYNEGSYFLFHISMNPSKPSNIIPELKLDLDIINSRFNLTKESRIPEDYECTLSEEMLPPVYRKSVRPLLEQKNVSADVPH